MDLNLRFFFFLPRWKLWFLGAERGEVRLGGGRRQAKEEICSEASFCQQEDLGLTWGKHLHQRPGSAAGRGFLSPPLWHEGCVGCEGSQIEPRSRGEHRTCQDTAGALNHGKEPFLPKLGLLSAQTGRSARCVCLFPLYAIFFSFSSRNLSSWENMPEGGFRKRRIPCALFLRLNFWRKNFSSRDS